MTPAPLPQHLTPPTTIGILGAGRQALETSEYCRELGIQPLFFFETAPPAYERDYSQYPAPVFQLPEAVPTNVPVITAVGNPELKRALLKDWPGGARATLISRSCWIAHDVVLGEGCTIAPMAVLNVSSRLHDHVLVNVGAILSHDTEICSFATISPRCAIGGGVSIGESAFLGIGATIRDHITIGERAVVAAGAVVVTDVPPYATVMGVPARIRS
jgi:acetyltransferase EpsM